MSTTMSAHAQRGVAALLMTLLLFLAMALGLAFTQRSLVFEIRTSAHQARSTQAFEAAEAGLEWALARLNDNRRIDDDCRPSVASGATSFRDRMLRLGATDASFMPITWNDGGVVTPLQAACSLDANGWSCSCPSHAAPIGTAAVDGVASPAFTMTFSSVGGPGLVRATAVGCLRQAPLCTDAAANADATAHVEVVFGLLSGLKTVPAAALTTRGDVDANVAAWSARNADAESGGLALHSGGAIAAANARIEGPAGGSSLDASVAHDPSLALTSTDTFFARTFGTDLAHWSTHPAVVAVSCTGDCAAALGAAIAGGGANTLLHVAGDLRIDGPVELGTPLQPIVIVANGAVLVNGAVTVHGVIRGASLQWNAASASGGEGSVQGAAISDTGYGGDGRPDFARDAATLARLSTGTGSFARVSGSWRDF